MTPKEKAKELVAKFKPYSYSGRDEDREWRFENAKQCTLIAVDEMLEEHRFNDSDYANRRFKYFQEVKQEILAL